MARTVSVETSGAAMGIYDVEPEEPSGAAVVVFQEAFGVNDHIEDVCRRIASAGHRAVAPHLFHRTGDPIIAYDDVADAVTHLQAISGPALTADLEATLSYLSDLGFDRARVGVVGFCFGGSLAFFTAAPMESRRCGHLLRRRYQRSPIRNAGLARSRRGLDDAVARSVRRSRPWHPDRPGGVPARGHEEGASTYRDRALRRRRPRVSLRRPRLISRGVGQGRLDTDARLVRHAPLVTVAVEGCRLFP